MKWLLHSLAASAALAGCAWLPSVGPDYEKPDFKLEESPMPDAGLATTNTAAGGEYKPAEGADDVGHAGTWDGSGPPRSLKIASHVNVRGDRIEPLERFG